MLDFMSFCCMINTTIESRLRKCQTIHDLERFFGKSEGL